MRSLFLFIILFGFLMVIIESRPSQSDENNEGQDELAEYEGDSDANDQDSEESSFKDEEPTNQDIEQDRRLLELNRNTYLDKNVAEYGADNLDNTDEKLARTREIRNDRYDHAVNEEFRGYNKPRRANRYIESNDANDQLETAQHINNRNAINENYKLHQMHNYQLLENPLKRTLDSKPVPTRQDTDLLFGNNRDATSKISKNDFNMEPYEVLQRQSANNGHSENRFIAVNNRNDDRVYCSRDRRAAKKTNLKESEDSGINMATPSEGLEKAENESEEMAIRRHIKKLSENELEDLFNSLTEEKQALLKQIMDDTDQTENNNINKREITKKAGAVTGYADFNPSESCKIEGGMSSLELSTEYAIPNSVLSETTKQSEGTILTNSKSESNSDNKIELKDSNEEKTGLSVDDFVPNADANKNQIKVASSEQGAQKTDKKRDTNVHDVSPASFEDPKLKSDQNAKKSSDVVGYFSTQDEDLSPFLDDQARFYDASKMYKRDVEKQSEFENKLKSLEESFPNPDSYDDPAPYSGPLVRVKRKDTDRNFKKRAAAFLPDSKVGFFSYKDTDDADNEEGSEFDDDGFYDPTPNFVSKENNKNAETNSQQAGGEGANCVLSTVNRGKPSSGDSNIGTISLGSDTDNVLSSVEGVDENLMFISGNRNRRKTEGTLPENLDASNHIIQSQYGKSDEVKDTSNVKDLNVPIYQESDSFGGLPHNYEGDLGRYKRIRRVKQSHVSENDEAPSSN